MEELSGLASLLAVIVSVVALNRDKKREDEKSKPKLVMYLNLRAKNPAAEYLVIKNTGGSPARIESIYWAGIDRSEWSRNILKTKGYVIPEGESLDINLGMGYVNENGSLVSNASCISESNEITGLIAPAINSDVTIKYSDLDGNQYSINYSIKSGQYNNLWDRESSDEIQRRFYQKNTPTPDEESALRLPKGTNQKYELVREAKDLLDL